MRNDAAARSVPNVTQRGELAFRHPRQGFRDAPWHPDRWRDAYGAGPDGCPSRNKVVDRRPTVRLARPLELQAARLDHILPELCLQIGSVEFRNVA